DESHSACWNSPIFGLLTISCCYAVRAAKSSQKSHNGGKHSRMLIKLPERVCWTRKPSLNDAEKVAADVKMSQTKKQLFPSKFMSGTMLPEAATQVFIALGSNLDDPSAQVERGMQMLNTLEYTKIMKRSSLYCSAPIGRTDQPDFINAVVQVE